MLNRLPAEVLDEILQLAAPVLPPEYTTRREAERRVMFKGAALVCKVVSSRAQALLWRQLDLNDLAKCAALTRLLKESNPPEARNSVRVIRAKAPVHTMVLREVLLRLPRVDEIQLVGLDGTLVDLSQLAAATGLRRLVLVDLYLPSVAITCTFPSLFELTLSSTHLRPHEAERFLTPSTLPSLEVFSFDSTPGMLPPLLPSQLKILHCTGLRSTTNLFLGDDNPTASLLTIRTQVDSLFLFDLTRLSSPDLRVIAQLHERDGGKYYPRDIMPIPALLIALLLSDSKPCSLHLPILLHPSDPFLVTDLRTPIEELLVHCKAQDVEVFWHDDSAVDPWRISKAFQRYARRLEAERALAGGGA